MQKIICNEFRCSWQGLEGEALTAPNPFEPTETVSGCPECLGIDTIVYACDEPDCWKSATCGTPTKEGYRSTCGKHMPKTAGLDAEEMGKARDCYWSIIGGVKGEKMSYCEMMHCCFFVDGECLLEGKECLHFEEDDEDPD